MRLAQNTMVLLTALAAFASCDDGNQAMQVQDYDGPMYELANVETLYSTPQDRNTAFVEYKLIAARQLVYENENMAFPEGIYIESYSPDGSVIFNLKADEGYYDKAENVYRAVGNVNLKDLQDRKSLTTEELFWKPDRGDESIYTDKFVIIETEEEKIYGEGLRASQNFEKYRILKPTGSLSIEDYQ